MSGETHPGQIDGRSGGSQSAGSPQSGTRTLACRAGEWLASRGAPVAPARAFLRKPIPPNVSWLHTLGSLLLCYLAFQTLTGILLGLYYSPSPGTAHASVQYIRDELRLGRLVQQMHAAGAGFVLVTALLHLLRSYFLGAYRAPRELLWLSGLALGVLLTLFAFTGQLLPYDQHGYWASVVGIEIASGVPIVGDWIRALLTGGYGDIGATTLSRFYILHVAVLPLALAALAALHLGILQRVGSAPRGPAGPLRSFHPSQTYKDVTVAALGALALLLVAAWVRLSESGPADPAAGDYVPRPEWYFLAHYEVLRRLPGSLRVVGTFVLPNAVLAFLVLLPFVDRGRGVRRAAVAAGIAGVVLLVGLTAEGLASAPPRKAAAAGADPVARGRTLFHEKKCIRCHTIEGQGGTKGPVLDGVARRLRSDYLPDWIRRPQDFDPNTEMPAFEGSEEELEAVVSFLLAPH